ncbi:MAG: hypothetical protein HN742_43110 [Lentisphaerae bacterium]|jgi:hypothetical protein|nr:hypothetical protein [Lentisphaerota bacterium]MBT5604296.1 hypothetical protein [Lentisphaerota bacterium]MBT7054468.1 hypothetical protein [Lentisphaerota bacterium]MBT7848728.1 hypothetical protein [Lentisphaerota bacterium]
MMISRIARLLSANAISLAFLLSAEAGLLKNGDFSQPVPGNAASPAGWIVPEGGHWARSEAGGPDGGSCLRYDAGHVAAKPVRASCDFLTPGSWYELKAMARSSSQLTPSLRLFDQNLQRELTVLVIPPGKQWTSGAVRFRAETANIAVEIAADPQHFQGIKTAPGQVWIAQVEILPTAPVDTATLPDLGKNVALGRPYTMTRPSYRLCMDPEDAVQLTDGAYTEGHFWTRKTTVGWGGRRPALITIDLGQDQPIKGLSCSTAAGVADVHLPARILVFVSPDGKLWHESGNLVRLHQQRAALPAYGEYVTCRLWTDKLATHGRYIAVYVEPEATYTFLDEIEVYRGDAALLSIAYANAGAPDLEASLEDRRIADLIQAQFRRDLAAVEADIAALPAGRRPELSSQAAALDDAIRDMAPVPMAGFRAVLPMTDLERRVFQLQAAVWRAAEKPALRLWSNHRWDPLAPSAEPAEDSPFPAVNVHMMRNEYRAGVLNLSNATDREQTLQLRITGLPGGPNPDYLKVHTVEHVGTLRFTSVAAALPEAKQVGENYAVTIPSGMTRQMWFSFGRDVPAAGTYTGQVEIRGDGLQPPPVPVNLHVYPLRFPDQTSLCVGGWSYSNSEKQYGLTPANRDAILSHLQAHFVNAPWATSAALPRGTHNEAGQMLRAPDTANFDRFVTRWPDARMYMVFLAVGNEFNGSPVGTDGFNAKVGTWAHFWAEHMRDLGLRPSQLGLLIYDEPHDRKAYDLITAWAHAIEAAEPELVTWEDPQPKESKECLEMFASVDVLCPYRNPFLARDQWYRDLFLDQQKQGRELWFYNADGPARSFDPFSFYLLQEWHAFKIGAKGSCFWAFADSGRDKKRRTISCWNEYPAAGNGPYCPIYLDETSVTAAKYMEAIREGIEDFEYLTMLKSRIGELRKQGVSANRLTAAEKLLATACDRVLAGEDGANYRWDEVKDRTVADAVRIEILQALTALAQL